MLFPKGFLLAFSLNEKTEFKQEAPIHVSVHAFVYLNCWYIVMAKNVDFSDAVSINSEYLPLTEILWKLQDAKGETTSGTPKESNL